MTFNPTKCEFLQLTKKNHPQKSHCHIDNKQIKQVTTSKYLGVTIDKNLNWSEHTSRVVNKANSRAETNITNIRIRFVKLKTERIF